MCDCRRRLKRTCWKEGSWFYGGTWRSEVRQQKLISTKPGVVPDDHLITYKLHVKCGGIKSQNDFMLVMREREKSYELKIIPEVCPKQHRLVEMDIR